MREMHARGFLTCEVGGIRMVDDERIPGNVTHSAKLNNVGLHTLYECDVYGRGCRGMYVPERYSVMRISCTCYYICQTDSMYEPPAVMERERC